MTDAPPLLRQLEPPTRERRAWSWATGPYHPPRPNLQTGRLRCVDCGRPLTRYNARSGRRWLRHYPRS